VEIKYVGIHKVVWSARKVGDDGEEKQPAKVTLTLEIEDPNSSDVKALIDFAKDGRTIWTIESLQRQM